MKKILLLISILAILSSCELSKSTSNMREINNISVVNYRYAEKIEDMKDFDLCQNFHRNDTLFLELLFKNKVIAYPYSQLKEEYLDSVKNYRITVIPKGRKNEYIPAIVESAETAVPRYEYLSRDDNRFYILKSILKDNDDMKVVGYIYTYLPLYLWGFSNAGNKMFYNSEFFFSDKSLEAVKTSEPFTGGKYSVVRDYKGKLQLCQMKYEVEEDVIMLRLEDGRTYRYPAALAFPDFRKLIVDEKVSAAITSTDNWFPVKLYECDYRTSYEPVKFNLESYYLIGGLWKPIKIKDARNYLFSKGMSESMINFQKLFFTKEEMDNKPPKEDLNFEGAVYRGFIDDLGQITMDIVNYGGRLEGAFYFESELKRYELSGFSRMDEENYGLTEDNITLTATRNNEKVGTFKGKWVSGKSFSGVWQPTESYKGYSFNVSMY